MLWLGSSICGFEGMCEIDSGCGSAWLERLVWDQEVAGSNPVTPIELNIDFICASGSVVEHHLAKVGAAGSNPVSRFFICPVLPGFFRVVLHFVLHSIFQNLIPAIRIAFFKEFYELFR